MRVRIVAGVMHEIRAHLAYLGHPVAGDAQYGGAAPAPPGLGRPFLHAWRIAIPGPTGGEAESPLPADLAAVPDRLT